jgi:DNA-binding SARP family transcriptional activator
MTPVLPLQVTVMGRFAVRCGDQELAVAASGQRLIALLAVRTCRMGRFEVARTLWPNYPAERSRAGLRTALWRVNQSSARLITVNPSFLRLDAHVDVDVHRLVAFARWLTEPVTPGRHADGLSLTVADLTCDLLPDWYDDWVQNEREGLRLTRLHALEKLARKLSASGRHADAIQAAFAAIRLEPLRESAHQTLIEMHLAEGNRSEAWRQFQRYRRLLRGELGVDPSESMCCLIEQQTGLARVGDPAMRPVVPRPAVPPRDMPARIP